MEDSEENINIDDGTERVKQLLPNTSIKKKSMGTR